MGLRFRRSVKLAPGVRLNLSGSGLSWTLGPRGASINVGKRGTYLNAGIPGTGLSARQRISGAQNKRTANALVEMAVTVAIENDGEIVFKNSNGDLLPEAMVKIVKKQQGDAIHDMIERKCAEINTSIDDLGSIHLLTPSCHQRPYYKIQSYTNSPPLYPTLRRPNFLQKMFKSSIKKIEDENQETLKNHKRDIHKYESDRDWFETEERNKQSVIEGVLAGSVPMMEQYLEKQLHAINWPRETNVSFDIQKDGSRVVLDVDLPELADMPQTIASIPQRRFKLSVKELGIAKVQKLYMQHVHGIGFRIIGEVFAALPTVHEVILSGYSQRSSKQTGAVSDEYIYSVKVRRNDWGSIRFDGLSAIDVVDTLDQFELKRSMTKTGIFKAVEPISS